MRESIFRWLARRSELRTLLVATLVAFLSGVCINVFTDQINTKRRPSPFSLNISMGSWNLLVLASIALLLLFQYQISIRANRRLSICVNEILACVTYFASLRRTGRLYKASAVLGKYHREALDR
jgi:hypothetical protein